MASVDVKTLPKPVVKPVLKQEVKPEPKVKPSPFKTTKAEDTKSPPKDAQEKLIKVEPATPKHSPPKKVFQFQFFYNYISIYVLIVNVQ